MVAAIGLKRPVCVLSARLRQAFERVEDLTDKERQSDDLTDTLDGVLVSPLGAVVFLSISYSSVDSGQRATGNVQRQRGSWLRRPPKRTGWDSQPWRSFGASWPGCLAPTALISCDQPASGGADLRSKPKCWPVQDRRGGRWRAERRSTSCFGMRKRMEQG